MTKIAFYSDFDGVFNIPKTNPNVVTSKIVTKNSRFLSRHRTISWNPEILTVLSELLQSGHYDFTWLTTWNDAGNIGQAARMMGLSEHTSHIPARLLQDAQSKREWTRWKAEEIIRDQGEEPRPYVWVDDDAPYYWGDYVQGNVLAPGLILAPHSSVGLTEKDVVKIIDFTLKNLLWNDSGNITSERRERQ